MKSLAPYQILFPIGILSSLIAVGVWFVQHLNWFTAPAMLIHGKLIMGGFLWSFIVGFLMTAVPKMTGTRSATRLEMSVALILILALIFQSFVLDQRWFYGTNFVLISFLLLYAGKRVLKTQKKVPVFFSHVGLAMIAGLLGCYFHFQNQHFLGIHLYHIATVLLLVLGIGTRFFSFLSGLPSEFESAPRSHQVIFHVFGLTLLLLLFLAGSLHAWAYFGIFVLTFSYLLFVWKIFRKSERPSPLKYGVRIVALMIPFSFFMSWMQPQYYLAWLHLLFIGCFGLITYAVATRVTLAHGSYSLDFELRSPTLWLFVTFLVSGMILRVLYGYSSGDLRTHYLHLAAAFWVSAILVWSYSFFKRIWIPGEQQRPSC